jgi:hypothetical protein
LDEAARRAPPEDVDWDSPNPGGAERDGDR